MSPKCHQKFRPGKGVVDPVKICLISSLIIMQNLVAVSHAEYAHVGSPKIRGTIGAHIPWFGRRGFLTPENTQLPAWVTIPNLVAVHQIWFSKGSQKFADARPRPLRWRAYLTKNRNTSLPTSFTRQIWSFQVIRLARNYGDPKEKFDLSRPAFEGHSRSLEPTRIDRPPMTSY